MGSGPSAFYCAKYILENQALQDIHVDMLEKLPMPYGLVRYGVAPDHPEVKNVTETFEKTAQNPRFRYFGNVEVGRDVSVRFLLEAYSAVVLGYGADGNRGVLDEVEEYSRLSGVYSAREFVNWYNGHPDYVSYSNVFRLSEIKNVVIVGHGNVALDCARILTKSVEDLKETDIADHAINELERSAVERVTLIGRRGPVQSAFTIKEFRELTKLGESVCLVTDEEAFEQGMRDAESVARYNEQRSVKRMVDLIRTTAGRLDDNSTKGAVRSVVMRYFLTPLAFLLKHSPLAVCGRIGPIDPSVQLSSGLSVSDAVANDLKHLASTTVSSPLGAIVCAKNVYVPGENVRVIKKSGDATGVTLLDDVATVEVIPCDLVLTAVGYKSSRIVDASSDGSALQTPFDMKRNVVPNTGGRVHLEKDSEIHPNALYTVGWVGRGPNGIIGTNIPDAKRTADMLVSDLTANSSQGCKVRDPKDFIISQADTRGKIVFCWEDFLRVNAEEVRRGQRSRPPRPRVKIVDIKEMVRIAQHGGKDD